MKIAIIGGGAAGCFCAIGLKRRLPDAEVTVYEAGPKLLAKVAVTGGGRCNLTNSFRTVINTVHTCHHGREGFGGTYVRCRAFTLDVLLTSLQSETIRRMLIFVFT